MCQHSCPLYCAHIHTNQQHAIAQGFLTADSNKAQQFFDLATEQFDTALKQVCSRCIGRCEGSLQLLTRRPTAVRPVAAETLHRAQPCRLQDPSNDVYRKAVEMTKKAPELHKELQRQLAAQGEVRTSTP